MIWLLTPTIFWLGGVIVFLQLLNIHEVNDDRQTEICTAESLVPEPTASEVEMAIEKLKRHITMCWFHSSRIDLKQEVGLFILRSISLLIPFGIRRNCLSSGRSRPLYLFIRRIIKQTSNYWGVSLLSATYRILSSIFLSGSTPYAEEIIGDHQCGFQWNRSATDHVYCIHPILDKNGDTVK